MMRSIAILLFTIFYLLFTAPSAQASESALAVAPAILEAVVDPDSPLTTEIYVANNTNFPLPVKGQIGPFLANEPISDSNSALFNASAWFTLEPADFILQPQETKLIKATISPPPDAVPGGHYATIYFQPLIPEGALTSGTTISLARVGVLTFLITPGDILESLELTAEPVSQFRFAGPITFHPTVKNLGTVHLMPTGSLQITNWQGKPVADLSAEPGIVLPHTEKSFALTWNHHFLLGKYQAILQLKYGIDQNPLSYTWDFWVVPLHLIIPLLLALTFVLKLFIVGKERVRLALDVLFGKKPIPK